MTEEVVVPVEQSPLEEVQVAQEQHEPTPIEQRAMEMGWRPKEDFQGSEDEFIDAKEFVRRQPLFEKIEAQNRHLKEVTKSLAQLKEHYTKVRETEYNRAIAELRTQRKEALSTGDGDSFERLDDQIKEAEQEKAKLDLVADVPKQEEAHPEFVSWKNRNRWYESVGYMKEYADEVGRKLHARGLAPQEVLTEVEKAVKTEFPHKFKNPNKESAPSMERSGGTAKRGGDGIELTDLERRVMNDLTRMKNSDGTPFMTKDQYIKDLKRTRGIA